MDLEIRKLEIWKAREALGSGMPLEEIAEKTGLDYELIVGLRMGYMEFENLRISQVMKLIELGENECIKEDYRELMGYIGIGSFNENSDYVAIVRDYELYGYQPIISYYLQSEFGQINQKCEVIKVEDALKEMEKYCYVEPEDEF